VRRAAAGCSSSRHLTHVHMGGRWVGAVCAPPDDTHTHTNTHTHIHSHTRAPSVSPPLPLPQLFYFVAESPDDAQRWMARLYRATFAPEEIYARGNRPRVRARVPQGQRQPGQGGRGIGQGKGGGQGLTEQTGAARLCVMLDADDPGRAGARAVGAPHTARRSAGGRRAGT
jgi:hypothetical protein